MKKILSTLILLTAVWPCASQLKQTGWTTTTNPATARAALQISSVLAPTNGIPVFEGRGTNTTLVNPTLESITGTNAFAALFDSANFSERAYNYNIVGYESFVNLGLNGYNEATVSNAIVSAAALNLPAICYPSPFIINVPENWQTNRLGNGHKQWNFTNFPSGGPWLNAFARSNGSLLAAYDEPQLLTTLGYPGMTNIDQDVKDLVDFGFSNIRCDFSSPASVDYKVNAIRRIKNALDRYVTNAVPHILTFGWSIADPNNTNVARVLSMVPPGVAFANLNCNFGEGIAVADQTQAFTNHLYAFWNRSPKTLIAHGRWTMPTYSYNNLGLNSSRSGMTRYAMDAAPLLFIDLSSASAATLTNREIYRIQRDLTYSPTLISSNVSQQVWFRKLANGECVVGLFNTTTNSTQTIGFAWTNIGLASSVPSFTALDVWGRTNVPLYSVGLTSSVPSTSADLYLLSPTVPTYRGETNFSLAPNQLFMVNANQAMTGQTSPSPVFSQNTFSMTNIGQGFSFGVPSWVTQTVATVLFQYAGTGGACNITNIFRSYVYDNAGRANGPNDGNNIAALTNNVTPVVFTFEWPVTTNAEKVAYVALQANMTNTAGAWVMRVFGTHRGTPDIER